MPEIAWKIGAMYTIESLVGDKLIVERLREFGFIPGEEITVLHRAPFGEPIVIRVRDTSVALRKLEIECIQIK